MFDSYRSVLREPGAAAFSAAGLLMRLPIAMYPVGLVLLVALRTGEYRFAGVLTAAYIAGGAAGSPLLGRLVDRHGQHAVLVPASILHAGAVAALVLCVEFKVARMVWLLPTVVAGLAYLAVGALVRARWAAMLGRGPRLSTAFSYESTVDEAIFVGGPLLTTLLATTLNPVLPLVLAPVLVLVGAVLLARLRTTEPQTHRDHRAARGSLPRAPMMMLVAAMAAMGATFAGVELSSIAYAGQHGQTRWAGLVLACFAFGSGVAGLLYGTRAWRAPLGTRFRVQAVLFAVLPLLLAGAVSLPVLAVTVAVVGLGIAPMMITGFGMVEALASPARLTEGLSWLMTGLSLGFGAAAAVVGGVADAHGARVAFVAPMLTAAAAGGLGWLAVTLARRSDPPAVPEPPPSAAVPEPPPSAAVRCNDGSRAALP